MNIENIKKRFDGTYEVSLNGLPYHVTQQDTPEVWDEVIKLIASGAHVDILPKPEPPKPYIPDVVEMRQAQLALLQFGYFEQVEDALKTYPGKEGIAARITWATAQTVRRDDGLVKTMSGILGLTEAMLDDLFITAAAIE